MTEQEGLERLVTGIESIAESLEMLVQQTGEREAFKELGKYMTGEAYSDIVDRIRVDE